MSVVQRLGFAFLLVLVPGLASAYDSPRLSREADTYAARLAAQYAATPAPATASPVAEAAPGEDDVRLRENLVAHAPGSPAVWRDLAVAVLRWQAKDARAPIAAFQAAKLAATDPEKAANLEILGSAYEQAGQFRDAIEALNESLHLRADADVAHRRDTLVEVHGFKLTGVEVESESDQPQFCLKFRGPLVAGPQVRYGDYVRVDPPISGRVSARGENLCLDGVRHGDSLSVTVLAGLPSADGRRTLWPETVNVEIGDRAPSVAFKDGTYVLPRSGSAGVPVITVNVDRVKLLILRVNDRNLIRELNDGRVSRLLGGWDLTELENDVGEVVWTGSMAVENRRNARVVTAFPVGDTIGRSSPGVYALVAEPDGVTTESWQVRATQWLVVSDLGLTTLSGPDGLHVFVRSLGTAKPVLGATVRLLARNNAVLAEAVSDLDGVVAFDPGLLKGSGGRAPKALFAAVGGADFTFLDIAAPAFDLSDRGVGGRTPPGPLDAYLYSDRGVYRRGETAHLVALLRDAAARAVEGLPLTVKVLRPDGAEARRDVIRPDAAGAYVYDLPIRESANTGAWTVQAFAEQGAGPIGTLKLLVEDIVPPTIEVRMAADGAVVRPGVEVAVGVKADFLYGAPAGGLSAEGEVVLLKDDAPFADYPGFRFGLVDETPAPQRSTLPLARTGADGAASVPVIVERFPDTTVPLKAVVRVGVAEPGGRPALASLTLPARQRDLMIGVKPRFADDAVAEGATATFDVVALAADGGRRAAGLEFLFVRERWDYRWFQRDGAWDYEVNIIDEPLGGGRLDVGDSAPAELAQAVEWGRYRLEVYDPAGGAATSVRFRAGWFVAPTAADRPDTLEVVADKAAYAVGETAQIRIRAPFAAEVLIAVANDRVVETRSVSVPAEGATVAIPVTADWGVGTYVLATAFRPDSTEHGPGRAIGLRWLGVDAAPRTLTVALAAPEEVLPRSHVDVPITVTGMAPGEAAWLTLAAVDDGVLQLTGFTAPDPMDHYFGKRRLAFDVRDLYGRLIDGKAGRRGNIRTGGGDPRLAGAGAPRVDVAIAALFSGIVRVDANGRAVIPLDLPDFNGRLRLMAVAFDKTRLGAVDATMLVRDPLVAQASLPRFLAPGDEGRLTLSLRNLKAPKGEYTASFTATGPIAIKGAASVSATLAAGEAQTGGIVLAGGNVGTGTVAMTLKGPDGAVLKRSWNLDVRPAQLRVVNRLARRLAPGETVTLSQGLLTAFRPGTTDLLVSVAPKPNLDVPGLLRALERYPYGCAEQTTSRALPLLYVGAVAELWGGKGDDASTRSRIAEAIGRLLDMQRTDGAFGLWGPQGEAEPWLTAYVLDFMTRAKARGMPVPDFAYRNGLSYLERLVRSAEQSDEPDMTVIPYALYDLAAAGGGDAAATRYFADRFVDRLPTAMATAQMATALALVGEADRARFHFGKAVGPGMGHPAFRDFGSDLRDRAAVVALAAEAEGAVTQVNRDWNGRTIVDLVDTLSTLNDRRTVTSSQEKAWLLLAAAAVGKKSDARMAIAVDGKDVPPRAETLLLNPGAKGVTVVNKGQGDVWMAASASGIPATDLPAMAEGFALTRGFYTLDGKPATLAAVAQNTTLVAVIEGEAASKLPHQALVVDLLPAGFEIENARLADRRATDELAWLPQLTKPDHQEFRDDRFVAAFDLDAGTRKFALAYLVRAVTPGHFKLPGAHVEDMYKPQFQGRTAMGSVTVTAGN